MASKKFFIAPYTEGQITALAPFLLPDNAWEDLQNVHLHQGKIERRLGSVPMNRAVANDVSQIYSRVGMNLGVLAGPGPATLVGITPTIIGLGGHFAVGEAILTIVLANGAMITTVPTITGVYNSGTGAFTITGAAADAGVAVYFYLAQPIMGLWTFETPNINNEVLWAFDTRYAYEFTNGRWERKAAALAVGDSTWTGNNAQFFWGTNYRAAGQTFNNFYVTNYVEADGLRYWSNPPAPAVQEWVKFTALRLRGATQVLVTCRIVIGYKGRLLLMATKERDTVTGVVSSFPNRIRISGTDPVTIANQATAFDTTEKLPAFITLPTSEEIISVGFIKDRLIVYCENSTWLLGFTGNDLEPFKIAQLNNELGVESQFSVVEFDRAAIGVGNVGIHATNGVNVTRIDEKINSEVFTIRNTDDGVMRVQGIRDYQKNLILWSFPTVTSIDVWPDKVLVYNKDSGAWSFYDDSITAFGFFQDNRDLQWQDLNLPWADANFAWQDAAVQEGYRLIAAGNQQGYVMLMSEVNTLAQALFITNINNANPLLPILRVLNHNLKDASYILIDNCLPAGLNINGRIYQVLRIDANTFSIANLLGAAGVYIGGGTIQLVPNISMLSKQYNFFQGNDRNVAISEVDLQIERGTPNGTITVDYFTDSSNASLVADGQASGAILGTNLLDLGPYASVPYEATQARLWHAVYMQAEGSYIQIYIYFNGTQMLDQASVFSSFTLHSMLFVASPTSARVQ